MALGGICVCCAWGAGCKGSGGEQAGTISGDKTAETGLGEEASKDSADGELESETAADESKDGAASNGEAWSPWQMRRGNIFSRKAMCGF